MTYQIYKPTGSNGLSPIPVPDNAIDYAFYDPASRVGIQLVGKNAADYGTAIAQNSVQMVSNFAGTIAPIPRIALQGQLWYNATSSTTGALYVRVNSSTAAQPSQAADLAANWRPVVTVATAADPGVEGQVRITGSGATLQIEMYAAGSWVLIYPAGATPGINEVVTFLPNPVTVGTTGTLTISGGNPNGTFTYSLVQPVGGGLSPSGTLTLDSLGGLVITGSPAVAGTYTYTLSFTQPSGAPHIRTATAVAVAAGTINEIVTFLPNPVTVGASATLNITGGNPNGSFTYVLSQPVGGSLSPSGTLTLSASGALNVVGIPAVAGTYTYTLTFPQPSGPAHTRTATTVAVPVGAINEIVTFLPNPVTSNTPATLSITGGNPNASFTFSLVQPAGGGFTPSGTLTLNSSGNFTLTGNPVVVGTYTYTLTFPQPSGSPHIRTATTVCQASGGINEIVAMVPNPAFVYQANSMTITAATPLDTVTATVIAGPYGVGNTASSTLSGSGTATFPFPELYTPGSYTIRNSFAATGHTRDVTLVVTAAEDIIRSVSNPFINQPFNLVFGPGTTGTSNNNAVVTMNTLVAPIGQPTGPNGTFTLGPANGQPAAGYVWNNLSIGTPGRYVYQYTFSGTGHVLQQTVDVQNAYDETVYFSPNPAYVLQPNSLVVAGGTAFDTVTTTVVSGPYGVGSVASSTLNNVGAATFALPELYQLGDYVMNTVFTATGHTRIATLYVNTVQESISLSVPNPTAGVGFTQFIGPGGISPVSANNNGTANFVLLSKPAGSSATNSGTIALNASGSATIIGTADLAGRYVYQYTFSGTGHILQFTIDVI